MSPISPQDDATIDDGAAVDDAIAVDNSDVVDVAVVRGGSSAATPRPSSSELSPRSLKKRESESSPGNLRFVFSAPRRRTWLLLLDRSCIEAWSGLEWREVVGGVFSAAISSLVVEISTNHG